MSRESNTVSCMKHNQNVLFEKEGTHSVTLLTFGSSAVPQGKQAENNLYGIVNQEWTVRWVEYKFNK